MIRGVFSLLHCLHTLYACLWCYTTVKPSWIYIRGRQGGEASLFFILHQSKVHWDMVLRALLYILFIDIAAVRAALFFPLCLAGDALICS